MTKPFVHYSGNYCQLYSGDPKDAVPFLSVGVHGSRIIFHIPGGTGLEMPLHVALEFLAGIVNIVGKSSIEEE